MSKPAVTLLGATSQIGVFAVPALLATGHPVAAVSRKGPPPWCPPLAGLKWVDASFRPGPEDGSLLVSAGPATLAREWVQRLPDCRRVVAFSTTSVFSKSDSPDAGERRLVADIAAAEDELKALCDSRGIELCLLRPTLVYGCGMDQNLSRVARWIRRWGFFPVARNADGLRTPVHAGDLAQVAVDALQAPGAPGLDSPLCGGSTLPYRDMIRRVFAALERQPRLLALPSGLLTSAASLGTMLRLLPPAAAAMVRRQGQDLLFDDTGARRALGWRPRAFTPDRADFELPDVAALSRRGASPRGRK